MKEPNFNAQDAHKYFAAQCFNKTWDFIDKKDLTAAETEEMIQTCMASLWHWSQRDDVTAKNLSIGFWQASRVFSLAQRADEARKYAQWSLEKSEGLESFYVGYAYEALARAEKVAGNKKEENEWLMKAREQCTSVTDAEDKKLLEADLMSLT